MGFKSAELKAAAEELWALGLGISASEAARLFRAGELLDLVHRASFTLAQIRRVQSQLAMAERRVATLERRIARLRRQADLLHAALVSAIEREDQFAERWIRRMRETVLRGISRLQPELRTWRRRERMYRRWLQNLRDKWRELQVRY